MPEVHALTYANPRGFSSVPALAHVADLLDAILAALVSGPARHISANPRASSGRLRTRTGYHRCDSTGGMA